MDRKDKVSVVVLSKNNASTLNECLKSISDSEGEKEIILVDAHSKDGTQKIIEKYRDNIKVIYDEGKGIGNARNLGIKNAKGEIICFVDADAKVSNDHFKKITKLFRSILMLE